MEESINTFSSISCDLSLFLMGTVTRFRPVIGYFQFSDIKSKLNRKLLTFLWTEQMDLSLPIAVGGKNAGYYDYIVRDGENFIAVERKESWIERFAEDLLERSLWKLRIVRLSPDYRGSVFIHMCLK